MLEIVIDPRRSLSLKQSITEAIESGEYETLQDDIRDCFSEDDITEIEEFLESGDLDEAIDEVVSEWSGDDMEDLLESIVTYFAEYSVEMQFLDDSDVVESEEFITDEDDDDDADEGEGEGQGDEFVAADEEEEEAAEAF